LAINHVVPESLTRRRVHRRRAPGSRSGRSERVGLVSIPRSAASTGNIGITFTLRLPHFEQTGCRCFGTSTKTMSFQSLSSSNVFTAWW